MLFLKFIKTSSGKKLRQKVNNQMAVKGKRNFSDEQNRHVFFPIMILTYFPMEFTKISTDLPRSCKTYTSKHAKKN